MDNFIPDKLLHYESNHRGHLNKMFNYNYKYLPHVNQWIKM